MATIVDSLVVTLGLDASGFKAGQEQARTAIKRTASESVTAGKEMEARGKQAAQFFGQIKTEALSLIGVLVGGKGLEVFVRDTTRSLADLGRVANRIGTAVPQLAAFRNMIERNGGSANAAAASLSSLTDAMEQYRLTGTSPMANFFNNMGIGRGDNAMQAYMKFVQFAQAHANDVPLINLMGHGIGLDQGTIDATVQMKNLATVNAEMSKSIHLGVADETMAKRMQQLQSDFTALGQAAEFAGQKMLTDLQPQLSKFSQWLTEEIVNKPQIVTGVVALVATIGTLGALRISASAMGLTGVADAIGAIFATMSRFSVLAMPLALKGDTMEAGKFWLSGTNLQDPALYINRNRNFPVEREAQIQPPAAGSAAGGVMERLRAFYRAKGLSDAQIAGILSNVAAESGFDPNQSTDDGGKEAYGLFQHRDTRLTSMRARYGQRPTVEQQAQFAWDELHSSEKLAMFGLSQSRTPAEAGAAFTQFERPANMAQRGVNRGAAAARFMPSSAYGPRAAPASSPSINVGAVTINTQASDMRGAGGDLGRALADQMVQQSNRGLQ